MRYLVTLDVDKSSASNFNGNSNKSLKTNSSEETAKKTMKTNENIYAPLIRKQWVYRRVTGEKVSKFVVCI